MSHVTTQGGQGAEEHERREDERERRREEDEERAEQELEDKEQVEGPMAPGV